MFRNSCWAKLKRVIPTLHKGGLRLAGIPSLALLPQIETLATALVAEGAVPPKARLDALHIATAAVHGVDYLLTWNFRHIANAEKWANIEAVCQSQGIKMPRICSPLELTQIA